MTPDCQCTTLTFHYMCLAIEKSNIEELYIFWQLLHQR
jgi:hypothetical protein